EEQSQADVKNLPASNADFAFKFYKQVRVDKDNQNIIFSPLSISTAFAMLSVGARSSTLRELHKGLEFNMTEQEIHEGFQSLLQLLNDPHQDVQLNISNALFVDERVQVHRGFSDKVTNFYYSEAVPSNFRNLSEATKEINEYMNTKTHGKIVDLVKSLSPNTLMVLINSIFFKGSWKKPFKNIDTREDDFYLDAKNSVKVKMMHQKQFLNVYRDKRLSCWVVELPYKGNVTSLFVVPDEEMIKQVENALLRETVSDWLRLLERRNVYLDLPKFSVSSSYDIKKLLKKMGVTEVFTCEANLSGVAENYLLWVSEAVHKTRVDVQEGGTEAAAATVIRTVSMALPPPDHRPVSITINKPFLMMVIDKTTDSLLFLVKIVNPA
ncbi:SPA3K inhibitor, partial [Origma solitaria]|nr:SPA3K inhibitor [Origma solitaria]